MRAKDAVQRARNQQRHVAKRAKRPVAQHHIAGFQFGMHLGHAVQVVRPQGRRNHLLKQAAAKMDQRQPVRDGKATARRLSPRLLEMLLQFLRVGHRETGAIQKKQTMTEPQPAVADAFGHLRRAATQEGLQRCQRKAPTGRAVGRARQVFARQVRHKLASHVAEENL